MRSLLHRLISRSRPPDTPPHAGTLWDVLTACIAANPTPLPDRTLEAIRELRHICPADTDYLYRLLRLMALHRSVVIQAQLLEAWGPVVQTGPFAGLALAPGTREGCYVPKLIGCYEAALHPAWEKAFRRSYGSLLNIGCADGYYAVGFARRQPAARIFAYDSNPEARRSCLALARLNGVDERLQIGGEFTLDDFGRHQTDSPLLVCDIEGAEATLLDPEQAPLLRRLDMIVETHGAGTQHTRDIMISRFQSTHEITCLEAAPPSGPFPEPFNSLEELDRLLALWEWRIDSTPWLVLTARPSLDTLAPSP